MHPNTLILIQKIRLYTVSPIEQITIMQGGTSCMQFILNKIKRPPQHTQMHRTINFKGQIPIDIMAIHSLNIYMDYPKFHQKLSKMSVRYTAKYCLLLHILVFQQVLEWPKFYFHSCPLISHFPWLAVVFLLNALLNSIEQSNFPRIQSWGIHFHFLCWSSTGSGDFYLMHPISSSKANEITSILISTLLTINSNRICLHSLLQSIQVQTERKELPVLLFTLLSMTIFDSVSPQ